MTLFFNILTLLYIFSNIHGSYSATVTGVADDYRPTSENSPETDVIKSPSKELHYNGYKVLRVKLDNDDQLKELQKLAEEETHLKINFWSEPRITNSSVDLMISPETCSKVEQLLNSKNITSQTLIPDVGTILEEQKATEPEDDHGLLYTDGKTNLTAFFSKYQPMNNIYEYLEDVTRQYPDITSLETIGKSFEGRAMRIMKIGKKDPKGNEKPIIWIDAGIHAREWIAPATALYIINKLTNHDGDPEVEPLLEKFDFHILSSANPDGYEFSRNFDRFWRKTRSRNQAFLRIFCVGVDPNRNYGYQWKKAGSSTNPCSNIYHGPYPFSEPETKSIAEHVLKNKDNIKLFLSLHSYSQLILTPWGWTKEHPDTYKDLMRVAQVGARALKMRFGTEYDFGPSSNVLYLAAGGSDDWAHGTAGIKYSYTLELRDKGSYGFLLPSRYIRSVGEETFDAIVAMSHEIAKELDKSPKDQTLNDTKAKQ